MSVYTTEEEQLEMLRKWWKKYGSIIVWGILLALLISFTWRFWQGRETEKSQHASMAYEQLLVSLNAGKKTDFEGQANYLVSEYPKTSYAEMGAMLLARQDIIRGKPAEALKRLERVLKQAKSVSLRQIARLRIARILLDQKKYAQALTTLSTLEDSAFKVSSEQLKGNIYLAQGKRQEARAAYQAALQSIPADQMARPLLQMQLDDLPA